MRFHREFTDGVDEAGDIVLAGLDIDLEAVGAQGFGSDGTDAGGLDAGGHGELEGEEIFDGGGAGKGDDIGAFRTETLDAAGDVGCFRNGTVGDGLVDNGAEAGELRDRMSRACSGRMIRMRRFSTEPSV